MFGFIFKKKVEVSKPSFKAEPTDPLQHWETCFHKKLGYRYDYGYSSKQEWTEYTQIKFSGRVAFLDCKTVYECALPDKHDWKNQTKWEIKWLPKEDLKFPE